MSVSFSDIAQLGLSEPDQIDWNDYKDAQAVSAPVDDGIYDVQAPDTILFDNWTDTNTGKVHLRIANDTKALTIVSEPGKGRKLFYPFVSARRYKNSNGSQMGDYIRSFGVLAQPTTPEEYAQLAQATANRVGKVQTKQEGYCKACGQTVFTGQQNAVAKCPGCNNAVKVSAKIDRWISTVPR